MGRKDQENRRMAIYPSLNKSLKRNLHKIVDSTVLLCKDNFLSFMHYLVILRDDNS
ncbi:hypothetical protein [Candidatus Kuenenia stuttgartiensis]|uniref:hypothetical protein n=1 Tax=Kuenenia stuttgartiensis TaxID=174633 RepID=UPI00146AD826|nr:hypothetical protein [Candidatus Kuenenia stuttgartiensis]